jgi:hypothetical protein
METSPECDSEARLVRSTMLSHRFRTGTLCGEHELGGEHSGVDTSSQAFRSRQVIIAHGSRLKSRQRICSV